MPTEFTITPDSFTTIYIRWIITLIALDVVLGIIGALVKKDFRLGKLANFMIKPVLGFVFGFGVVLTIVAEAIPSFAFMATAAFVLVVLALIGSILNNLSRIGLPMPEWLKK